LVRETKTHGYISGETYGHIQRHVDTYPGRHTDTYRNTWIHIRGDIRTHTETHGYISGETYGHIQRHIYVVTETDTSKKKKGFRVSKRESRDT